MGLYIQMHSMHGLFRGTNPELGRDEDTGGQITYVLDLAKAFGKLSEVDKVDIITRNISDCEYSCEYANPCEEIAPKVNIVRIECGPEKYIKKVNLWPCLGEFVSNTKKYIETIGRVPDILHSNYADSGLVCVLLSEQLGIPQVHTGHSLGIPKLEGLLSPGKKTREELEKEYHFKERIKAENMTNDNSELIVASTRQEVQEQYAKYGASETPEKFRVIAPGFDENKFYPPRDNLIDMGGTKGFFENSINQFAKHPERAVVGVLSRLDTRKNLMGLLNAFAGDKEFQKMANLLVVAPTLEGHNKETQGIIDSINEVIRENDLYDKIVFPGKIDFDKQVPEFYRFLASRPNKNGIFVNPALIEPFGLTTLEAGACGVPVVATNNGGPTEVITPRENGLLIDPQNPKDIASQIKDLIQDRELYERISKNIQKIVMDEYTWASGARKYVDVFKEAIKLQGR